MLQMVISSVHSYYQLEVLLTLKLLPIWSYQKKFRVLIHRTFICCLDWIIKKIVMIIRKRNILMITILQSTVIRLRVSMKVYLKNFPKYRLQASMNKWAPSVQSRVEHQGQKVMTTKMILKKNLFLTKHHKMTKNKKLKKSQSKKLFQIAMSDRLRLLNLVIKIYQTLTGTRN